ncbi:hypothetical protein [uncultured Algibacter sp.]|uniref:hypothetical protein n=1 Tax=uncultured Algibacter sp. TaxID=298659 RepID=UPI00262BB721|nr:hypothetical protein [uncultured Algibacter sp.]
MKNKPTLKLCVFFILCSFSLIVQAQNNNVFQLKVIKYSLELDSEKPRYHILSLQNNSNKELTINLSNVVEDTNGGINKSNQNLIVEILNKDLNKPLNLITIPSNETIKFKVKITFHPNARLGSMNLCKIIAEIHNSNNKESVKINTFIPHPNLTGH